MPIFEENYVKRFLSLFRKANKRQIGEEDVRVTCEDLAWLNLHPLFPFQATCLPVRFMMLSAHQLTPYPFCPEKHTLHPAQGMLLPTGFVDYTIR